VALRSVEGAAARSANVAGWPGGGPPPVSLRPARYPARILPKRRLGTCPEVDCIRGLLPHRIIAAAERRARSIGLGAERVLICADAITEEAYLVALAAALGTTYEPLDRVPRNDCPLSDHELIQAAAAGLLPLRRAGRLIWVIAPRCGTARRLADPHQPHPQWLRPFCLTSSEHLRRFVARHAERALGRTAADALKRSRPLFSNAPRTKGWRSGVAIALAMLAVMLFIIAPAITIGAFGTVLCLVFLATATLRLWSAFITDRSPRGSARIGDDRLPIYTIICALYRESAVIEDLSRYYGATQCDERCQKRKGMGLAPCGIRRPSSYPFQTFDL
jgi:glycosyltransferase XagB